MQWQDQDETDIYTNKEGSSPMGSDFGLESKSSGGSREVTLGCRTGPKSCGEISDRLIAMNDLGSLTLDLESAKP
jgi:hypothetical protein